MFTRSARFYNAIYAWKDYAAESRRVRELIEERNPDARTLLDVACGTGTHMGHLKDRFEVTGFDVDPQMVEIARRRHPNISIHEADMVDFDIDGTFDAVVCLFSSIAYAVTLDNLGSAIQSMTRHLNGSGVLIVEPFITPDAFETGKPWALFVDEPELKIARLDVPEVAGRVATITFHYLVATNEGVEYFTELHRLGLFTHEQYLDAFRRAGFEVEHDQEGLMGRGLYVGVRR